MVEVICRYRNRKILMHTKIRLVPWHQPSTILPFFYHILITLSFHITNFFTPFPL